MMVGPVLQAGSLASAVIAAIVADNPDAGVEDRGAYLRVLAPGRCCVRRVAVEACLGAGVAFPGDLEAIMPSFQGRITVSEDVVIWDGPPR